MDLFPILPTGKNNHGCHGYPPPHLYFHVRACIHILSMIWNEFPVFVVLELFLFFRDNVFCLSMAMFTLQALMLNSHLLIKSNIFGYSDHIFKCGLSANCGVNCSCS